MKNTRPSASVAVSTTNGGNLESPGNTCGLNDGTDQTGVADPLVGALADNGGPTDTHDLLKGSPAIDTGVSGFCPAIDQRGAPRPFDGDGQNGAECDIGAVEAGALLSVFADGFESGSTSAWSATVEE